MHCIDSGWQGQGVKLPTARPSAKVSAISRNNIDGNNNNNNNNTTNGFAAILGQQGLRNLIIHIKLCTHSFRFLRFSRIS